MSPEIEALIARKKAERAANGLALRITFDKRDDFTGYYVDKKTFDEMYDRAVASIGKVGRDGITSLSVEIIQ